MTEKTQPTDAEILDAADDFRSQYKHRGTTFDEFDALGFARAVLAKWGSPVVATNVSIPTHTMEQEFQNHYRRGFEAGKKAGSPVVAVAPYGCVTTHCMTGQQFFYRHPEPPYLDNASECVTVYAKEKHPRQSDQDHVQVAQCMSLRSGAVIPVGPVGKRPVGKGLV